jgi:predicted nucleotidyltransferase
MIVRQRIAIPEDALAEIARRYRVRELSLFGSILRDDFHDGSDIDVLVEFEPDARIGYFGLARLQRELEEVFGRRVDVVSKNGLKPLIRQAVLDSAQILCAA